MAFLCPSRSGKNKEKKQKVPFLGRITGSASIDTLVRVGLEKQHGLKPDSRMVAQHDFLPCGQNELEICKGQDAYVLYRENEWAYVITEEGKEGFVPNSFLIPYKTYKRRSVLSNHENDFTMWEIEEESEPEDDDNDDDDDENNNNDIDFTNGGTNGINEFTTGDVRRKSTGILSGETEYIKMKSIGLKDSSKINTVSLKDPRSADFNTGNNADFNRSDSSKYVVLFDLCGIKDSDISVEQGEVVQVLIKEDKGRMWIRKSNNKEGFIPSSFCCLLKQDPNPKSIEEDIASDVPPPLPPRDYEPLKRSKSSDTDINLNIDETVSSRRISSDSGYTESVIKPKPVYQNNGLPRPPPYRPKPVIKNSLPDHFISGPEHTNRSVNCLQEGEIPEHLTRSLTNLQRNAVIRIKDNSKKSIHDNVIPGMNDSLLVTKSLLNLHNNLVPGVKDNSKRTVFNLQDSVVPGIKDCMNRSVHKIQSLLVPGIRDNVNRPVQKVMSGIKDNLKVSVPNVHDIPVPAIKGNYLGSTPNIHIPGIKVNLKGSVPNIDDISSLSIKDNLKTETISKPFNKPRSPDFVKMIVICDYRSLTEPGLNVKQGEIVFIDYNNQHSVGKLWVYSPTANMYGNIPATILKQPHQLDEQFTKIALV